MSEVYFKSVQKNWNNNNNIKKKYTNDFGIFCNTCREE